MDKYVLEIFNFFGLCMYIYFFVLVGFLGGDVTEVLWCIGDIFFVIVSLVLTLVTSIILIYILKKSQEGWFWKSLIIVPIGAVLITYLIFLVLSYLVIFFRIF